MQEELQLRHLPRYEKKRLVKGWHATQAASTVSSSGESSDSMRSLFATPPGALAYESQRSGTWRSTLDATAEDHDSFNQQQEEKLPKTVGQVQQAYRVRARKQEARDASNALRKREMFLDLRRGPRWREQEREAKTKDHAQQPAVLQQEVSDDPEHEEAVDTSQYEDDAELQLLDLPEDQVVTNAAYRDEVLRQIRCQLAQGGEVLLQSDCTTSKESVSNTRLMLQTLCIQSLAHCIRDQNIVPETLGQLQSSTRLALRLLPRHQRSVTPSPHTNITS